MHIPFVRMVKFKFLAHLPGDHLADPVVSSLILQVSRNLLSILSDFCNTAVWMVLLFPSPPVPLLTLWCTKRTNYNWYKRHVHVPRFFFHFLINIEVFTLLFTFFFIYFVVSRDSKVQNSAISFFFFLFFFLLIIIGFGRLAEVK